MGIKKIVLVGLVIFNLVSWSVVFEFEKPRYLEVCFFDVGEGDAIFIKTPLDHQILIDGGPNDLILKKLKSKMPFFDKSIDLVVLTHPQKDHLYGLLEVLKNFKVENILWTGVNYESNHFREWERLKAQEKAKVFIAKNGLVIKFSENGNLKVLYPFENLENKSATKKEVNDTSIILKLNSFDDKILFTGDASQKTEAKLLSKDIDLSADILKIAHHGSRYSSSSEFLKEVMPSMAVISVGRNNPYNHPAREVLERLNNYNIKVERTDKNGDICLIQKKKKQFSLLNLTE
jgi:competence protein ComEC